MGPLACAMLSAVAFAAGAESSSGAELWRRRCAMCHGDDGRGHTQVAERTPMPDLTSAGWQSSHSDEQIRAAIRLGGRDPMPAFKDRLTSEDLDALIRFIRALGPGLGG
jgi:mono/diheme cytochrome c family protein